MSQPFVQPTVVNSGETPKKTHHTNSQEGNTAELPHEMHNNSANGDETLCNRRVGVPNTLHAVGVGFVICTTATSGAATH